MGADDQHPSAGRMEGAGYYTEHSEAQGAYGELGFEWLEQAAAEVDPSPEPLPFAIADLGAAGGGNSLEPISRALAARRGDGPALVVHTDIPANDFSALFELVSSSPGTYVADGVYALAEGRSFYERLFPEVFLSLGWSSIAVHWLSAVAEPIPDHIYCSFATGSVREALRSQSSRDWRAFLAHRARELRPSGRMIVIGGAARDEDGMSDAEGLMDAANSALQELVAEGGIEGDEYARMTIPTWNRTPAEFLEPFESGAAEGLELRRHAARWLPDRYFEAFERDGDLDRYVASVTGFFRAAFAESLWSALDPGREAADRAAIAQRFERLLAAAAAAAPEQVACRWHVVVLDIARVPA